LRVTLRGPVTVRSLPSLAIPMMDLGAFVVAIASLLTVPHFGLGALALAALVSAPPLVASIFRTARMAASARLRRPRDLVQAFLVALVYDAGRAAALAAPARHRNIVVQSA
jgi:hypothetical protein